MGRGPAQWRWRTIPKTRSANATGFRHLGAVVMRVTISLLGFTLDLTLGRDRDDEPEFDEYQDAGTTSAYPIGFAQTPHPGWERPLNTFDEPGEGDEDV